MGLQQSARAESPSGDHGFTARSRTRSTARTASTLIGRVIRGRCRRGCQVALWPSGICHHLQHFVGFGTAMSPMEYASSDEQRVVLHSDPAPRGEVVASPSSVRKIAPFSSGRVSRARIDSARLGCWRGADGRAAKSHPDPFDSIEVFVPVELDCGHEPPPCNRNGQFRGTPRCLRTGESPPLRPASTVPARACHIEKRHAVTWGKFMIEHASATTTGGSRMNTASLSSAAVLPAALCISSKVEEVDA